MADKTIVVYTSSLSSDKQRKKHQSLITDYLEANKYVYKTVDITADEEGKKFMQDNIEWKDGKKPLPPQIFCGQEYCGDFDAFEEAKEMNCEKEFFKLASPSEVSKASITLSEPGQQQQE